MTEPVINQALIDKAQGGVVSIMLGNNGSGSGVIVAPEHIVTCYHCIKHLLPADKDTSTIENAFVNYAGKMRPVKLVRAEKSHDLCLLEVTGLTAPAVPIGTSMTIGEPVVTMGKAYDKFPPRITRSEGIIKHLDHADDAPMIFSSAPFMHGDSGGGLFNAYGELIGINAYEHNVCIPAVWVKRLLERNDNLLTQANASAPKTQPDYFNSFNNHMLTRRSDCEKALKWAKERPDSYWAQIMCADYAGAHNTKEAYEAAKRAYSIYSSDIALSLMAGCAKRLDLHAESEQWVQKLQQEKNQQQSPVVG